MATYIESELWALPLAPKKTYSQEVEMPFRITSAALATSVAEKSRVFVVIGGVPFVLCSLTPDVCEQQTLNHVFVPGEEITLYTDGENTIHLTGNFLIKNDEEFMEGGSYSLGSDDSDYTSEDDDEEDEEDEDEEIDSDFINDEESDSQEESEVASPKIKELKENVTSKKDEKKAVSNKVLDTKVTQDDASDNDEEDSEDEDYSEDDEDSEMEGNEEGFNSEDYDSEEEEDEEDEDEDEDEEDDSEEDDSEEDEEEDESEEEEANVKNVNNNKRSAPVSSAKSSTPAKKPALPSSTNESKPTPVKSAANTPTPAKVANKSDAKDTPLKAAQTPSKITNESAKKGFEVKKVEGADKEASSTPKPTEKKDKENTAPAANNAKKSEESASKATATPTPKTAVKKNEESSTPVKKPEASDNATEAAEKKVVSLGKGLTYEDVQPGKGPTVTQGQKVSILYKGMLTNGKVFDENFSSKKALSFVVGKKEVVSGLEKAIEGAKVGTVRKITIPPELAYGNKKLDGIPANSTLTFEVKVLSVAGRQQRPL